MDVQKNISDDVKEFGAMEIMKKIFFFDIDGTFLCENTQEILPSTKSAYKQLLANGHDVYLCTGRNKRDTLKIANQLNAKSFIASNGQYIEINEQEYFSRYIAYNDKVRYLEELSNCVWGYMTSEDIYIIENDLGTEKEVFSASWMQYSYAKVEDFLKSNVISVIIIDRDKTKYPMIAAENNMYFWSGNHFQVVPNDVNKGVGIKELVKSYDDEVEIYCFGDNDNDIQMFEIANCAVAMGNATEDAKSSADIITKKSSEDGIYHALKELGVINE